MKRFTGVFDFLAIGIAIVLIGGCATCPRTPYRKELTNNPKLEEAQISYKKTAYWIDKGDCSIYPFQAKENYAKAESYLSDTIFKLKRLGSDNNIDVSEEVEYCERLKSKLDVNIGYADKEMLPP